MVVSMTGFATRTITLSDQEGTEAQLTLSLKSLNSRYFEATCKLPYALTHLETELIKLLKKILHRGHIIFSVQVSNPNLFKGPVQPDMNTVKSYLSAIEKIKKECTITGETTIHDLIMLPNIFSTEEQTIDPDSKTTLINAINTLVDQLVEARMVEGSALEKDLLQRVDIMKKEIDDIEQEAEELMTKKKTEVNQKLSELDNSSEFAETQRAALYFELDKMDIHEEIVRFKNHLATFKKNLESTEQEKGRRLDFILQELARETNTIAAKCGDSKISSFAINIKVEVEKAREQVQNIV